MLASEPSRLPITQQVDLGNFRLQRELELSGSDNVGHLKRMPSGCGVPVADIGKSGTAAQVGPTGLIGFGLLCLLGAAVGGAVKGLGFELPTNIDRIARFQVAVLGLAAIAAGGGYRWWLPLSTAVQARLGLKRPSLQAPIPVRPLVGRQEELRQVESELRATSRVSITGLGGVGKTRIAMEYVSLHKSSYAEGVFWLRGETEEQLAVDFAAMAGRLELSMVAFANEEIEIKAVQDWLGGRSELLLVIDNLEQGGVSRLNGLVAGLSVHVLATSRYPWWGRAVPLGPLPPDAARELLQEGSDRHDERWADPVSEELGRLPIALEQAASYMRETGQSLAGFYQLLKVDPSRLLAWKAADPEVRVVAATWSLSIQRIQRTSPAAADLLRLCAFLGTGEIRIRTVIEATDRLPDPLRAVTRDRLKLDAAIRALLTYSMVERSTPASAPDEDYLLVHRLVQRVVRDSLTSKQQRNWAQVASAITNSAESPRIDRMATAALVCGLLGFVCGGWILSGLAIWLGRRAQTRIEWSGGLVVGAKRARIGFYLGIAGLVWSLVLFLFVLLSSS